MRRSALRKRRPTFTCPVKPPNADVHTHFQVDRNSNIENREQTKAWRCGRRVERKRLDGQVHTERNENEAKNKKRFRLYNDNHHMTVIIPNVTQFIVIVDNLTDPCSL